LAKPQGSLQPQGGRVLSSLLYADMAGVTNPRMTSVIFFFFWGAFAPLLKIKERETQSILFKKRSSGSQLFKEHVKGYFIILIQLDKKILKNNIV